MLTTSYKIISKILVEQFKPIIPKVVNKQQTGFVQGRCISDNLLTFRLNQEHVVATLQNIIFLKLDFEKAFDKVDHDYLWATLSAMGLDPLVITLIQGLVMESKAKVHVNGLFTLSFPWNVGLGKGTPCPLSYFPSPLNH